MPYSELLVFKHDSELGNASAQKLFQLIAVKRKDEAKPPKSFSDYQVTIDQNNLPAGVTLTEML